MLQKEVASRRAVWRVGGVLCCLIPFLFGQFQQLVLHQLAHSNAHVAVHTAVQEADPCHRSIFHQGSANNCDHPCHLTATDQECSLCDSIFYSFIFKLRRPYSDRLALAADSNFISIPFIGSSERVRAKGRAPPIVLVKLA